MGLGILNNCTGPGVDRNMVPKLIHICVLDRIYIYKRGGGGLIFMYDCILFNLIPIKNSHTLIKKNCLRLTVYTVMVHWPMWAVMGSHKS